MLIDYGNGAQTTYDYDPLTFRLVHLLTRRNPVAFPGDCPQPPPDGWPGCQVQNLHYTYDPIGNITHIRDDAQQTIYLPQQTRRAERRLHLRRHLPADRGHRTRAPGAGRRVHRSRTPTTTPAYRPARIPATATPWGHISSATSTTRSATFEQMQHIRQRSSESRLDAQLRLRRSQPARSPARMSNRLTSTTVGGTTETYSTEPATATTPTATCCACRTCRRCSGISGTSCR